MANGNRPWERGSPKPAEPPPRSRRLLWLVFIAALLGIVVALARAFPGSLQEGQDWAYVATRLGLVVLIAGGLFHAGRGALAQHLRYAAIWAVIFAVLALGAAYSSELAGVGRRLQMAFGGGHPVATDDHELMVLQDEAGAFAVIARVEGRPVRFLVDTGATNTVLSPADARRLGIPVDTLRYLDAAETANGVGYSAPYVVGRLELGPIRLDDFPVSVNQAPMSTSLLGRSFLGRLESFEVRGKTLTLRWRGDPG